MEQWDVAPEESARNHSPQTADSPSGSERLQLGFRFLCMEAGRIFFLLKVKLEARVFNFLWSADENQILLVVVIVVQSFCG